jgi:hypothetical protein
MCDNPSHLPRCIDIFPTEPSIESVVRGFCGNNSAIPCARCAFVLSGRAYRYLARPSFDVVPEQHMDWLDLVQWPATAVTVLSGWMVASQRAWKRNEGFWLFLLSNILWVIWGLHDRAFALVLLQLCIWSV